ncbi:PAS domain S-box protein [Actinoplanes sp. HUAS TT8]|uniref:PAS domain S-box protein n=1 Tax=Actinoplanes sp. HUAS TT8 TaxID=3447453 RepID=UPI003F52742C
MLDRLTRLAGRLVNAPVALVSMVEEERQVFPSAVGLPEPWASRGETPLSHSFCQHVVAADAPLIVSDARTDHRVCGNLAIKDLGVAAYAGFPLRAPQGQPLGSFCVIDVQPRQWSADELAIVEDLAAAIEAEIAMRLSHAKLMTESRRRQAVLNAAADAFVTVDGQGIVSSWNSSAETLFGWDECEALGHVLTDLIIPDRLRAEHAAGLRSWLPGQRLEQVAVDREGREFPVEMSLQAQVEQDGTLFHAFLHDVSVRKAREKEIADSEVRFRSLFESSPIGMALVGLDGVWLRVNPAMAGITGYGGEELLAMDFQSITHPDDLDRDLELVEQLLAGEIPDYRMHKRYLRKGGTAVWCLLSVTLVRDETGTPQHFLAQVVEVDAERRSQELLDVTFASSPDLHLLTTPEGVVVRANTAWQDVMGWTEDELVGSDATALIHPDDRAATLSGVAAATSGPASDRSVTVVNRYRTKTGDYRWLQWHGAALPGQGLLIASGRDITDARAVQEALRRSEEQSRVAFDASPLGMVIADDNGRFVRVNPAFARMIDLPVEDLLGRDYRDFTHPEDLAASRREVARIVQDQQVVGELEKRFLRDDGTVVWARVTITAITGPDGQTQRLVQAEDITVRKDAEERAGRESERLRSTIAIQREVAAAAADRDRTLQLVAERATAALPAAEGAIIGLLDGTELYAAATAGVLTAHRDVRVSITGSLAGQVVTTGTTLRCDDIETDSRVARDSSLAAAVRSMIVAPLFADGQVFGTLGVSSSAANAFDDADTEQLTLLADALTGALRHADDTAHRARLLQRANEAVAALEISEARFRSAFDNSPLGMVLTDIRAANVGVVLQANAAMATITGYPTDRLTGMRVHDFHHPEDHPATDQALDDLQHAGIDTLTSAKRYRHADGHTVWVQLHAAVIRDDQGAPLYLITQVQDVTTQRQIEQQLHQRAQLLDLTQDAVIVRDLDGHIIYWNPAAEHIYGWAPEIAAGHDLDRLLGTIWTGDVTRSAIDEELHAHGAWAGELEHRRADGRRVSILSRKALQRDPEGNPVAILSINTDISARRHAEQALQDSERRFRSQFAHSAVGQVIRGADDRIQEVNPAFAAMLGYSPEQLVGTKVGEHIAPQDHQARIRALATLFAGQADSYQQECQLIRADGGHLEVHTTVSAIRDETGHPERFVGLFQDISDRKAAEIARDAAIADLADRNSQLEDANRLKQDLMGMLGHEIGNPLCSILGYTEIFTDCWDDLPADRQKKMLQAIDRNAHLINGILGEVLTLVTLDAGAITATPETVNLRDHLEIAVANTNSTTTTVDCSADLTAGVQPGHLAQILTNLLSNARKYGGGATMISATSNGTSTRIAVQDAGPGVPAQLRPHLFERFSRAQNTATTVKGTGLGLYIVRELARANNGDIHYEQAPQQGSIFILTLPVS